MAAAATAAMLAACGTAGNRDLEPHIPALVSCIAQPAEVPNVIAKLSATTFVQVGASWRASRPRARAGPGGAAASAPPAARTRRRRDGDASLAAAPPLVAPPPAAQPARTPCLAPPARRPRVLQAMEDATLAVMVPLMLRALRERSTVVQRRASVIIENMSKLVRAAGLHGTTPWLVGISLNWLDWLLVAAWSSRA